MEKIKAKFAALRQELDDAHEELDDAKSKLKGAEDRATKVCCVCVVEKESVDATASQRTHSHMPSLINERTQTLTHSNTHTHSLSLAHSHTHSPTHTHSLSVGRAGGFPG